MWTIYYLSSPYFALSLLNRNVQATAISMMRHGGHKSTVNFACRDRNSFLNLPEVFVFSTL